MQCHLFIHTPHFPLDDNVANKLDHICLNLHSQHLPQSHLTYDMQQKNEHVCDSFQSSEEVSSGRFTLDESCNLLELVMNQQKTKNFDSLDIKKINFKAIGDAMHRFLLS